VYPASASLGTLTNAKCSKPGTMFISCAAICRACLRSIFLVAFPVGPSGNMNIFLDMSLVSLRSGSSSSGAALDVAPKSKKAYWHAFLFANLLAQCAATLLVGWPSAIAIMATYPLVWCSCACSSCSLTRQASGDQKLDVCSWALCAILGATISKSTLLVPGVCQVMVWTNFQPGQHLSLFALSSKQFLDL
jgi:hypothetical protein